MYRFFQRNQKKLLAIFGAFLMVVFILPTTFRNSSGRENPVVAYMGDEKIRAVEVPPARADRAAVRRINGPIGPFQQIPYARLKLGRLAVEIEQ